MSCGDSRVLVLGLPYQGGGNEKDCPYETGEKTMRKIGYTLLTAVALMGAADLSAQTTATASAAITVPTLLEITLTNTNVTFANPTFANYDAGEIAMSSAATVVDTRGNVTHAVQVTADQASMNYTGTHVVTAKPSTDLQWSADAGTTWAGLSTTAANVATALARGTNTAAATVSYKMLLNATNDMPGDYAIGFTYTIIAN